VVASALPWQEILPALIPAKLAGQDGFQICGELAQAWENRIKPGNAVAAVDRDPVAFGAELRTDDADFAAAQDGD